MHRNKPNITYLLTAELKFTYQEDQSTLNWKNKKKQNKKHNIISGAPFTNVD